MSLTRRALGLSALLLGPAAAVAAPSRRSPTTAAKPAPVPTPSVGRSLFDEAASSTRRVAGIAEARFAADDPVQFLAALGTAPGLAAEPWLSLSGGGENGAFGAGLLAGWSDARDRPSFSVVTGISTGALTAPFAFAGPAWDERLRAVYTSVSAADIFEFGSTPESLLDTWPLGRLIDRHVDGKLLADVAAEHRRGRRLFVLTTNVDTGRPVGWNLGAIADAGGGAAEKLFQDVLLASSSIPGIFPPVYLEVDTPAGRIVEMHVDGGVTTPFYVAPEVSVAGLAPEPVPARRVYVVINNQLAPDFSVTPKTTLSVLGRSLSAAVKAATRAAVPAHQAFARRAGIDMRFARIGPDFTDTTPAPFDRRYMGRLFAYGHGVGRTGRGFDDPAHGFALSSGRP